MTNPSDNSVDLALGDKASELLGVILESSTRALSHVNLFGYTYMHMAPTPTVGQMAVLLRLLEANIDVILTQKKVELTVDVKAELEKSLIQIHLMNKLSDAITQQDKSLFDATVVELEQTIPA